MDVFCRDPGGRPRRTEGRPPRRPVGRRRPQRRPALSCPRRPVPPSARRRRRHLAADPSLDVFDAAAVGAAERLAELLDTDPPWSPPTRPTATTPSASPPTSAVPRRSGCCWRGAPTSARSPATHGGPGPPRRRRRARRRGRPPPAGSGGRSQRHPARRVDRRCPGPAPRRCPSSSTCSCATALSRAKTVPRPRNGALPAEPALDQRQLLDRPLPRHRGARQRPQVDPSALGPGQREVAGERAVLRRLAERRRRPRRRQPPAPPARRRARAAPGGRTVPRPAPPSP